jgi:hypothetical protein
VRTPTNKASWVENRIERLNDSGPLVGGRDKYLQAIATATRWLMAQEPTELLGDDSVGWWLPLYAGFRIPFSVRGRLYQQLEKVLPTVEVGKSTLYTATAVTRTLVRSGLLTARANVASRFRAVLNDYMQSHEAPAHTPQFDAARLR